MAPGSSLPWWPPSPLAPIRGRIGLIDVCPSLASAAIAAIAVSRSAGQTRDPSLLCTPTYHCRLCHPEQNICLKDCTKYSWYEVDVPASATYSVGTRVNGGAPEDDLRSLRCSVGRREEKEEAVDEGKREEGDAGETNRTGRTMVALVRWREKRKEAGGARVHCMVGNPNGCRNYYTKRLQTCCWLSEISKYSTRE